MDREQSKGSDELAADAESSRMVVMLPGPPDAYEKEERVEADEPDVDLRSRESAADHSSLRGVRHVSGARSYRHISVSDL